MNKVLYGIALFIFTVICLMLIGIILLQSSKTGGMGTAMGGAAVQAAFGGQGADKLLTRITIGLAVAFMLLAIGINFIGPGGTSRLGESIVSQKAQTEEIDLNGTFDVSPTPATEDISPEESSGE